jgi:hypothetical protein
MVRGIRRISALRTGRKKTPFAQDAKKIVFYSILHIWIRGTADFYG